MSKTSFVKTPQRFLGCVLHRRLLLFCILSFSHPVWADLTASGYLPWYSGNPTVNTDYHTSNAFSSQMKMLDEVVYFGEFEFQSDGTVVYNDPSIDFEITSSSVNWYTNQMSETLAAIKTANPNARITFTIGGAGHSDGFASVAAGVGARTKAAEQIATIIDKYGFDGVDLDWEGASISHDTNVNADYAADAANYGMLAETIKEKLSSLSNDPRLSVTLQYDRTLVAKEVKDHVDLVRVMTYDAPETDPTSPGNHTSLSGVTDMITDMINAGIDPEKLGVGAAFYGLVLGTWSGNKDFSVLDEEYKAINGDWLPDDVTKWENYGFDSVDSIKEKIAMAKEKGLQEIFVWELTQDSYLDLNDRWLPLTTALASASAVPIPASVWLFGSGLIGLFGWVKRKRRC